MWERIKSACFNSVTMAVQYVGLALGVVMANLDNIATIVGDPGFVAQVQSWFGGNPKVIGGIMAAFSIVTMMARLRTLLKKVG